MSSIGVYIPSRFQMSVEITVLCQLNDGEFLTLPTIRSDDYLTLVILYTNRSLNFQSRSGRAATEDRWVNLKRKGL